MPLYEYFCPKCEREFELLVFGNQKPECPHCGNRKPERRMSVPAGHVRSSGTDSCSPSVTRCGGGSGCPGCPMN